MTDALVDKIARSPGVTQKPSEFNPSATENILRISRYFVDDNGRDMEFTLPPPDTMFLYTPRTNNSSPLYLMIGSDGYIHYARKTEGEKPIKWENYLIYNHGSRVTPELAYLVDSYSGHNRFGKVEQVDKERLPNLPVPVHSGMAAGRH